MAGFQHIWQFQRYLQLRRDSNHLLWRVYDQQCFFFPAVNPIFIFRTMKSPCINGFNTSIQPIINKITNSLHFPTSLHKATAEKTCIIKSSTTTTRFLSKTALTGESFILTPKSLILESLPNKYAIPSCKRCIIENNLD